jgi:hypothetical protein
MYRLNQLGGGIFAGRFATCKNPVFPHLLKRYFRTLFTFNTLKRPYRGYKPA